MLRSNSFIRHAYHILPNVSYLRLVFSAPAMLGPSATIGGASLTWGMTLGTRMTWGTGMTACAVITHIGSATDALKGMRPLLNMRRTGHAWRTRAAGSAAHVGTVRLGHV